MNLSIIDNKELGSKNWFLCKCNIKEYILSLNEDMFNYEVQRGIVKNKYLDSILNTIKLKEPLPLITLTSNQIIEIIDQKISITDFEILDGLQRTYRLWLYYKVFKISKRISRQTLFDNIIDQKALLEELKSLDLLKPGILSVSQVRSLLKSDSNIRIDEIEDLFSNSDIYINIWFGLNNEEIIKKMLILNAGQKPVTVDHQYELMFLHLFKDKEYDIKLIRYKDEDYNSIKTGSRRIGEFIFSSVIISIQSFIEKKPLRLSIDYLSPTDLDDQISIESAKKYFSEEFISNYFTCLKKLDNAIYLSDPGLSMKWFVKDTTMSGIMAALGYQSPAIDIERITTQDLISHTNRCFDSLIEKLKNDSFRIHEFFIEYDNIASTRINIGDTVRNAIFKYTISLLDNKKSSWSEIFKKYLR